MKVYLSELVWLHFYLKQEVPFRFPAHAILKAIQLVPVFLSIQRHMLRSFVSPSAAGTSSIALLLPPGLKALEHQLACCVPYDSPNWPFNTVLAFV